jgi:hypothetical protein
LPPWSSLGEALGGALGGSWDGDVEGLGVWLRLASSDGVFGVVVAGTRIPVAGSLKDLPTNAKAATDTPKASAIPASPSPMIVTVRFMRTSLAGVVITNG